MRKHLVALSVVSVVTALTLTACDAGSDPADPSSPDGAAEGLAQALSSGDLGGVAFTEIEPADATTDYAAVIDGMAGVEPSVSAGDVTEIGDQATVTLDWSWPVAEQPWAYSSTATMSRTGDTWEVVWEHDVVEPSLNSAAVLDLDALPGPRGDITGQGGAKLVTQRPVVRVGIDKTLVKGARALASARALAPLAQVNTRDFVAKVRNAGDLAFVEAIVYRTDEVPNALSTGFEAIRGARLIQSDMPLAVTRDFAAPILGRVGEVTAEMVQDDPDRYQPGDVAGLSGLQATYDEQLQGADGVAVQAVSSDGRERELFRVEATPGTTLDITLNQRLQRLAESLLDPIGPPSALVAIRPSDGAVLAAANGPGNNGQNFATTGQYAPGSTFKSVSALALIRRGVTADTPVPCTDTVNVDGRNFGNYDNYPASGLGNIPFRTAVANSCNTAFIAERTQLRDGDLAAAAASLGLGTDVDLGFPAFMGQVPDPASETEAGANMIGQGTVLASPLAMATVVASIQNGSLVVPQLVTTAAAEPPADAKPVTNREADVLRTLLRGVVESGSGSALADVPGAPVIAKTGTAEFTADDGSLRNHAWMIAAQGDLAVAVLVADGVSGSTTAGPIMEAFLRGAH